MAFYFMDKTFVNLYFEGACPIRRLCCFAVAESRKAVQADGFFIK
jgi:hypothetical protein